VTVALPAGVVPVLLLLPPPPQAASANSADSA